MLTEARLAQKRHKRTMASRAKKAGRRRQWSTQRNTRFNHKSWLGSLAQQQTAAEIRLAEQVRRHEEERKTIVVEARHQDRRGIMAALGAFFSRRRG